ncbi:Putative transposase [Methylorubrum aminovorans]
MASTRGLTWAVGIAKNQKVYDPDVRLVPPGGWARKPVPDQEPREAEAVLAALPWRRVPWRHGTKGALSARFAMTRVRVGDGPVWANNRHLPGAEVWLVGEWRSSGGRKYYLSNLPPRTALRALAGTIKARWVCEQAQQQLKEELGLDHFEGRSWTGLHRHALMMCIGYAYLQHLRLAQPEQVGRGGKRGQACRDRRRLRACPLYGRPSSGGCSRRLSRPCNARTVDAASSCRLTSKRRGSVKLSKR